MALRFYRGLNSEIQALSFDLDDTLYYNEDVIRNAERAQFEAVSELLPNHKNNEMPFWLELKWQVAKSHPELCHNVTAWRRKVITSGLAQLGMLEDEIGEAAEQVFARFYHARSDFSVPQQTFDVLRALRQRYPLVAVTNGNVDIDRVGLSPYFVGYYRSGENQTRMKPHPDMLHLVCQHLDLNAESVLHIGDNEFTDVGSAHRAGCASLWFNPNGRRLKTPCLPDGEYSDLDDLLQLL